MSAAPAARDRLRFGTFLAPTIMPVCEAVTEEVGRRLGVAPQLVVETDYAACAEDRNEVCLVCSLPYVEFSRQGISPALAIAASEAAGFIEVRREQIRSAPRRTSSPPFALASYMSASALSSSSSTSSGGFS